MKEESAGQQDEEDENKITKCGEICTENLENFYFMCFFCCGKFDVNNSLEFIEHLKNEIGNVVCDVDKISESTEAALQFELKSEIEVTEGNEKSISPSDQIVYQSDDDDVSKENLRKVSKNHKINKYKRKSCSKAKPQQALEDHQTIQFREIKHICLLCKNEYPDYRTLVTHKKEKHGIIDNLQLRNQGGFKLQQNEECGTIVVKKDHDLFSYTNEDVKETLRKDDNLKCNEFEESHTKNEESSISTEEFKCDKCIRSFKVKELLLNHINYEHAIEKISYQCSKCDINFDHLLLFEAHQKVHIEKPARKFMCEICNKTFLTELRKRKHRKLQHETEPYICPETGCKKQFRYKEIFDEHKRFHLGMNGWECEKCNDGRFFLTKSGLRQHRTKEHDEKYACFVCSKKFFRRPALELHVRLDHGDGKKEFLCTICGQQFARDVGLKNHLRCHANKRDFKCNFCEKGFNSQERLRMHALTHSDERNYKCEHCPRKFKTPDVLKQHRNLHFPKKYSCKICLKDFSQSSGYISHMKIHKKFNFVE